MKKVFLDDLPRKGKVIDWINSVGHIVKFVYEDIEGEFNIIGYDKEYLNIKYIDNTFNIKTSNFSRASFGTNIGKYKITYEYKYQVGDIIDNLNSGKLKILELTKRKRGSKKSNARYYKYECLICGHKDIIWESSIINGNQGCGVCANKKVTIGINDIWTTNPELGNLLWNHTDGYKYTSGSKKKVDWKCPDCNAKISSKEIYSIKDQGLSCPRCSDGISYPNKIMYHVLTQAGIEFNNEWSPVWAVIRNNSNKILNGKKRYDFYISSLNCVVEMHGGQHYTDTRREDARSLEEERENDALKEKLIIQNGIAYISIDAQKSELEHIKKNILNSNLANLIDFSNIDWNKCDKDSSKSLMIEACEIFKNNNVTTTELVLKLRLSKTTIIRYLKRGTKMGICNYNAEEEARKSRIRGQAISAENSKKSVIQFSMNGEIINEFDSAREAAKFIGVTYSVIPAACVGKQQSAGGYRWMYKNDYNYEEKNINPYSIKRKSSPVVRMTLDGQYIDEYESIKDATDELGINYACISEVCTGKQKTAGGYKWMYRRDYSEKIM